MENGLSSEDVKKKIEEFGFNELPDFISKNWIDLIKQLLKEPMFILLISSSFIYMFIGDYREGDGEGEGVGEVDEECDDGADDTYSKKKNKTNLVKNKIIKNLI